MAPHGRSVLIVLVSLARTSQGYVCKKRPRDPECLRAVLDRTTQMVYVETREQPADPPLVQPVLPVRQVTGLVTVAIGAILGRAFDNQVVLQPPQVVPVPKVGLTPAHDVGRAAGSLGPMLSISVLVGFAASISLKTWVTKRTTARAAATQEVMLREAVAVDFPMECKTSPSNLANNSETPPSREDSRSYLGTQDIEPGTYMRQVSMDEPQPELEPEKFGEEFEEYNCGEQEHEAMKMPGAQSERKRSLESSGQERKELKISGDHDRPPGSKRKAVFHRISTPESQKSVSGGRHEPWTP